MNDVKIKMWINDRCWKTKLKCQIKIWRFFFPYWSSSAFTKTCLFAWRFALLYVASLPPQEGNYEPNSFNSLGSKAISKEVFWFWGCNEETRCLSHYLFVLQIDSSCLLCANILTSLTYCVSRSFILKPRCCRTCIVI